jgi:hypothetical protein
MDRILIAILLLMFIILGCSNRAATTIKANVNKRPASDTWVSIGGFNGSGFDVQPVAALNGRILQCIVHESGASFKYGEPVPWLNPGDTCHLLVDYGFGVFERTEILPGEFRITAPDTAFVLYYRDNLTVNWEAPVGADWYTLYVMAEYFYWDTAGNTHIYYYTLDTTLFESTCTISGDQIFPSFVDSVNTVTPQHCGKVEVRAISGPYVTSEDKDQLFTSDTGWFNCYNRSDPVYFGMANPQSQTTRNNDREISK